MALTHPRAGERLPGDATVAAPPDEVRRPRFGALSSARIRIVASFMVLFLISAVASLIVLHQVLIVRLENRVDDLLRQEVQELERFVADGRDPRTGQRFQSPDAMFDVYFSRNVPGSEEGILAFVDGTLVHSRLLRFPLEPLPPRVVADWRRLSTESVGTGTGRAVMGTFASRLGPARYQVVPVSVRDRPGAFVVAILPAAELREIGAMRTYGAIVAGAVLVLTGALTWFVAGRALAPVRPLTTTAYAISESDLARRVEVRGSGEAAEMARSFNAMLDRLEGVFRGERQFVRDASHELRDPLTICLGYIEQLEDAPAGDREAMRAVIAGELARMGRIVDGLQGLAEAEHPDFLRLETIDLVLFAHELVVRAAALGPRRWTLVGGDEGVMTGDRDRLTEAVMNLAHNAVQQTREGDEIAIGVVADGDEVRLSVRDDGPGVPEAEREAIFERLVRGEDGRRRYRGSGLGLPIVKLIAEAHGGRTELRSRVGQGSTFSIVVPARGPGRGSAE